MAYFVKSTRSIGLTQSVLHFNFKSGFISRIKSFIHCNICYINTLTKPVRWHQRSRIALAVR